VARQHEQVELHYGLHISHVHEPSEQAAEQAAEPAARAMVGGAPSVASMLALQRTAGNAAVGALIARRRRQVSRFTDIPVGSQTPTEWPTGVTTRVADDGTMAVAQDGRLGGPRFWADPGRVTASNKALTKAGSVIRLKPGPGTLTGTAPNGKVVTLTEVQPENVSNSTAGPTMEIWADCGKSARDVFGVGGGTGKNYDDVTTTYEIDAKQQKTSASSPEAMKNEIFENTLGYKWYWFNSAEAGWEAYKKMTPAERDRFDRRTKINAYATPEVGEGFTMSSGGSPFPGVSMWNFHWAGVVMTTADDRVTLENYSVSRPMEQNSRWKFQMYGPQSKSGQTFHEQHLATKQHGDMPITMRVSKR
jgi:hypothetical protein